MSAPLIYARVMLLLAIFASVTAPVASSLVSTAPDAIAAAVTELDPSFDELTAPADIFELVTEPVANVGFG